MLGSPDAVFDQSDASLGAAAAPAAGVTTIEIRAGDSAGAIGDVLYLSGLITSARRFDTLVNLLGWGGDLEPGIYTFESGLATYELLRRIHSGETSPLRVTIPEGWRSEQVAALLAEAEVASAAEVLAALRRDANGAGTLAQERPAGASLEGYLFPSTYRFPLGATADQAVRMMLERFDQAVDEEVRTLIARSGRSLHEILTAASIIEREVVLDEERPVVAAVIWNRLNRGMRLQMDPTVQYAVASNPSRAARDGYWPLDLLAADLQYLSPYNTYVVEGLPPTPIASPGLASIRAAASPADVPYLYFVARGDGSHVFAVTYEEHETNVERYRASQAAP